MAQNEEKRPVYKSFSGFAFAFTRWQRAIYLWFCAISLSLSAHGQVTANWTGNGHDSLWTDANNWDTHLVPGANDTANIDLAGSNLVVLNTDVVIGSINLGGQGTDILQLSGVSIQCSSSISISNGAILEIIGNSAVVGGSLQNFGSIIVPPGLGELSFTNNCNFTNYGTIDVETNSILDFPSLDFPDTNTTAFESGTVFAGPGTVQFDPENVPGMSFNGSVTVDGTIIWYYAFQTGNVTWTGPGLLQFIGGGMTNVTFAPGFNVQLLSADDNKYLDGACTNQGTIRVLDAITLTAIHQGQFYNSGLLQIETNCYLDFFGGGPGDANPSFQNTGTIQIPPGLGELSLTIQCAFTNYGVIDVETNSALNLVSEDFGSVPEPDFESGTVFAGTGTVELGPNGFTSDGTITGDGTVIFNSAQSGDATWTGPGLLQFIAGGMVNVTFAPGFNVQLIGPDSKTFDGACTNEGTMRMLGIGGFIADPAPYNTSLFYNSGLFQIETNFDLGNLLGFQNTGTIKIPSGIGVLSLAMDCPFTNYGVIDVETNSALSFADPFDSAYIAFESGTVFAGAGTVELNSLGDLSIDGKMTADGTVILNSETLGNAIWTGPGLLQFLGIGMNSVTFAPGFNVQIIGPVGFYGACTNEATIRVLGEGQIATPFGGPFYNSGLIQIETNFYDLYGFGFQNTGTIRVLAGLGALPFVIESFTNSGVIDVETNSELVISNDIYGSQFYQDGTTFNGSGLVSLASDYGGIQCSGSMTDNCALNLQSDMSGASTWTGSGHFSWLSGAISNITFAPGFHAQISGSGSKFLTGICANQGTVSWLGGSQLNDSMTSGQFNNSGILQISGDGIWNNIIINNGGTFCQSAGAFFVPFFRNMRSVQTVSGSLNVASNFISSANSSYQVTVNGTTPGTNFNQLNAQILALSGSLQVVLANGFSPAIGNSFPIMTGRRVGSFSSATLPAPQSNLMWHVQYLPSSVALEVAQPGALTDMGFANGAFQFSLNGFASGSYDIQASSNLIDWTTIETNYPFSGSVTVTDTNADGVTQRYYRARIFP